MKILSHRGYWLVPEEKNKSHAFERSFKLNFGTETDIRDHCGRLVISHDISSGDELDFVALLDMAEKYSAGLTMALNIKSDGLVRLISQAIRTRNYLDCFVFDMSVPDMRAYLEAGVPVFTRMSEVERFPAWLDESDGVWLDSFNDQWYDLKTITDLLSLGKRVCIVSPELHMRDFYPTWQTIKPISEEHNLILCTDFPELAQSFFGLI